MESLPASQDALRLELRLAAGAGNDADADDGLPLLCLSFSHTLVHRCRPRAVVDLFLLSIVSFVFPSSLLTGNLCPPFSLSPPFSLPFARLDQVMNHVAWILCSRPYGKTRENPSRNSFSGAAFEHLRVTPRSTSEQYFRGDIRLPPNIELPDTFNLPIVFRLFIR